MWRAGRSFNRSFNMVAIGLWLAACSPPPEEPKTTDSARETARETAKETIFGDSVEAMDRARAVEDTAAEHRRQLEQAEQQAEGR